MGELQVADVKAQVGISLFTDFENFTAFKPSPGLEKSVTAIAGPGHRVGRSAEGASRETSGKRVVEARKGVEGFMVETPIELPRPYKRRSARKLENAERRSRSKTRSRSHPRLGTVALHSDSLAVEGTAPNAEFPRRSRATSDSGRIDALAAGVR